MTYPAPVVIDRRFVSRVTSGRAYHLRRVDGRTPEGLRERDQVCKLAAELGVQSFAELSFEMEQLARAAVRLALEAEKLEWAAASGEVAFDPDTYARLRQQLKLTLTELRELAHARVASAPPSLGELHEQDLERAR